ncbi:MAG: outer membrane protein transport protein [Casimicrobiaceae bacterium]
MVAAAIFVHHSAAWAGGLGLYEVGSPDLGTASAAAAALAEDASTAWGNPAGMTRLQGSQLLFGLQPLIVTTEFDTGTGTTTTGPDGGNAGGFVPSGGLYGVYEINPDLKLGAALNSYAGGALNYDGNWVGRYFTTETELVTFNLNPVIAYRIAPWVSLGVGFSVQYATLKQELATPNVLDPSADGRLKYQDHNFGFGGNLGALFEIDAKTRVGLTYRSQVGQSFSDVPSFSRKPAGVQLSSLNLDMTIPQEVMLSGYRELTDDLAIMANFDWQNWSQFGQFNVTLDSVPPRARALNANFDDTYQAAIGMHYRLGAPTMLQLGFAYDSSALTEAHRSPSLPIDQQFRFAGGVTYAVTDDYTLGFAYEYASLGSAPVNTTRGPLSGTLQGDYSANTLNVLEFTVSHRF